MTDKTHLDELISSTTKSLSRKLVESFRDAARDANVAKTDYVQRLRDEMEAALQEERPDAVTQPDHP